MPETVTVLQIGKGAALHLPGQYLATDPLCGGVRINGQAQARRTRQGQPTCKACIKRAQAL